MENSESLAPTHLKGPITEISNYRPISNLCALSKVFEKLVLQRLWEVAEKHRIDLTGETQHGFKPKRSTVTACLALQSIFSRAIDEKNYVAVASLDLSAAFDVVDRSLLNERLKIMGLPCDLIKLIKESLRRNLRCKRTHTEPNL